MSEEENNVINESEQKEEKKKNLFDGLKKGGVKIGQFVKDGSKFVAEKAGDVAIWAGEAKDKAVILADEAADASKKIAESIKQAKRESDYRILRPVFADDLINNTFDMPRMINLCEIDDKRKKNPVCLNSIGFQSSPNDMEVLNIFTDQLSQFNISVFPEVNDGVYYVNPCIPGTYISVEKYFKYIKEEKVRELVRIAKDLGAKRVVVEISEKEATVDQKAAKAAAKAGKGKAEVAVDMAEKKAVGVTVAANEKWSGHNSPKRPELVYFKNENHILDLIEMRFDPTNKLESHTYEIEYTSSASIKMKEAVKIDGALKAMKCSLSESMSSGAERSERTYFRYTVEFPTQDI